MGIVFDTHKCSGSTPSVQGYRFRYLREWWGVLPVGWVSFSIPGRAVEQLPFFAGYEKSYPRGRMSAKIVKVINSS